MAFLRMTTYEVSLNAEEKEVIAQALKYALDEIDYVNKRFGETKVNEDLLNQLCEDFK